MRPFKVMTFNVRGSLFEIDGENIWENRAALNVSVIRRHRPDIIGFQEYQLGNEQCYAEHLPDYAYSPGLRTLDQGEYGMHNAIYWYASRFDCVDGGGFYISPTPRKWSTGWDAGLVRAANWVRLEDRESGQHLLHINVHLDHLGHQARIEGSRLVVRQILDLCGDTPAILTGDFNSRVWQYELSPEDIPHGIKAEDLTPAGVAHSIYTEAGFTDVYLATGNTDGPHSNTFHEFQGANFPPFGLRIDWIMTLDGAQQFIPHTCNIIRDARPPLYPSDHYPVLAELSLL